MYSALYNCNIPVKLFMAWLNVTCLTVNIMLCHFILNITRGNALRIKKANG